MSLIRHWTEQSHLLASKTRTSKSLGPGILLTQRSRTNQIEVGGRPAPSNEGNGSSTPQEVGPRCLYGREPKSRTKQKISHQTEYRRLSDPHTDSTGAEASNFEPSDHGTNSWALHISINPSLLTQEMSGNHCFEFFFKFPILVFCLATFLFRSCRKI